MDNLDIINHPKHYLAEGRDECIVEMEDLYGIHVVFVFCLTNVFKYLYRKGTKEDNSETQDFAKAMWYFTYATNIIDRYGFDFGCTPIEVSMYYTLREELEDA